MKITKLSEIDVDNVSEFTYKWGDFTKDHRVKTFIESKLGITVKAVFTDDVVNPSKNQLKFDATTIIVFMNNGATFSLSSSEWATLEIEE